MLGAVATCAMTVTACSHFVDVGETDSSLVDPGVVHSYAGAIGLHDGAVGVLETAFGEYVVTTGTFTDELNNSLTGGTPYLNIDARLGNDSSELSSSNFKLLLQARGQAQQAIGAMTAYAASAPQALTGELYAIEGMSEVMVAELFCSGVPLDDTPFGKDFSYSPAISRTDVLNRAVAHFDSAAALATDSAPIETLAKVGKGRALLDLGQYADAAAAVSGVPTDAQYAVRYQTNTSTYNMIAVATSNYQMVVTNNEGHNGMTWVTSPQDPRVPLVPFNGSMWQQAKYGDQGSSIVLADGVEARLIEAEAQLQAKDYGAWIGTLQTLAATKAGVPTPTDPGAVNGSDSARVSLQFHERAFWLYLTGHREGDLRRLIRQYGRIAPTVYPSGAFSPATFSLPVYGADINVAPPRAEFQYNPLYKGCIDRNA
jgi:hypothetical protein